MEGFTEEGKIGTCRHNEKVHDSVPLPPGEVMQVDVST